MHKKLRGSGRFFTHFVPLLALGIGISLPSCTTAPQVSKILPTEEEQAVLPSSSPLFAPHPEPTQGVETIAILGTNDIHGTLSPTVLKTREKPGTPSVDYEAGGLPMIASFVKTLRTEFGSRFLWLDAGDEFQGSIESNLSLGAPMVDFFNQNHLNAASIGNHEFDFGQDVLKTRMTEARYPYLAANILEKTTRKPPEFPNTYPHRIYQVGRLKVGVLGLSTLDTPVTTRARNVQNLDFENLKSATLRESLALRKQGAHLVVVVAHAGLKCLPGKLPTTLLLRKPTDHQGGCGDHDEMVRLLRSLPAGTVDAVVAGHTHTVVHHWVSGVPVIQGGAFGRYLNVIYLTYDWAQKRLMDEESRIEGPIPVCTQVFQNQNDCNGDRPAPRNGRGPLVAFQFHGKTMTPDSDTLRHLQPLRRRFDEAKNQVLGQAARPIEYFTQKESPIGNLVADAIKNATQADFAYINPGGTRISLEAGPLTFGKIFQVLPFDNEISILKVSPKELRWFLQVAQNGAHGFGSVSGLRLRLIDLSLEAPYEDLNHDGEESYWEAKRLLELTLPNGKPLDPNRYYTLATSDFLVTGGDGLSWPVSQIPAARINLQSGVLLRDALAQYVRSNGPINTEESPLIHADHPRFVIETDPARIRTFIQIPRTGKKRRRVPRPSQSARARVTRTAQGSQKVPKTPPLSTGQGVQPVRQ